LLVRLLRMRYIMRKVIGKDVLEAFVKVAPHLNDLVQQDVFVGVTDKDAFLAYHKGETIGGGIKIGDRFPEGSTVARAMKEREKVSITNTKEVYGVPYKANAIPVFDENDQVIGAVAIGTSTESETNLSEILEQFSSSFLAVNSSVQEIAAGADNMAKSGVTLSGTAIGIKEEVKKTDNIMRLISEIADQTKLLGLNAAIEAARVGAEGRGFAVVAEEIRKLSFQSNNSAKDVNSILVQIAKSTDNINREIQEIGAVSEEQSAATEQIAAAMQQLTAQLQVLRDLACTL